MSNDDAHLLIVDDDERIRGLLQKFLMRSGFLVSTARDAAHARRILSGLEFDLIVLDVMMPGEDGMSLCRDLRKTITTPVMLLTAKGGTDDRITGLEAGADDYLVKPFHMEELLARLRALVRRASGWAQSTLQCGPIGLDTASQSVTLDGQAVVVTAYEYKLLEHLMLHAGEVVSKTALSEHLYEEELDRDSNVLEVLVGQLRRKLDPGRSLNPIATLRGRGYRLQLPRSPS